MALKMKKFGKAALAALALAAIALPFAGASATGQDMTQTATLTAEQVDSSRALFTQFGCAACHQLADAGANGHIGPAMDGNTALTVDSIKQVVADGRGAMPSFGGMVSEEEIDTLARYIISARR